MEVKTAVFNSSYTCPSPRTSPSGAISNSPTPAVAERTPARLELSEQTRDFPIPPPKENAPRGVFKKSHTCGSLFAKCNCYNESKEGRTPLLQTFSHPVSESYTSIRKTSAPKIQSSAGAKHLVPSNTPTTTSKKLTLPLSLNHPEIPIQNNSIAVSKTFSERRNTYSRSVPKYFESQIQHPRYAGLINDYSNNFFSNQTINGSGQNIALLDDQAQQYFKESGIFGPMGNGVATIRRNSILNENPIGQSGKVSKTMCIGESKRKNSGVPGDYEYIKSVVTQLKKELSDNEIKVGNLEKDLIQAQKELKSKESEVVKLQSEVHKLKVSHNLIRIIYN